MSKGFFRLVGRKGDHPDSFEEIDVIAKQVPFTLGRNESSDSHLCLGKDNGAISREHGRIYWDSSTNEFMIEVLGKNKCSVDRQLRSKGDKVKLGSKSAIRFSNVRLYFLPPEPEAETVPAVPATQRASSISDGLSDGKPKGYADYVTLAFEAIGSDGKALSAKNIIDWANENFAEVREQKRVNLYQGVYTALKRRYERLEEELGDRNGYLWRRRDDNGVSSAADNNDAMSDGGLMEDAAEEDASAPDVK